MKFKPGDKVLITKPKDIREGPAWMPEMDCWHGKIVTLRKIDMCSRWWITEETENWSFEERWLSLADAGAHCSKCRNHAPFANPSPSFVCWECKNYPHYRSVAEEDL